MLLLLYVRCRYFSAADLFIHFLFTAVLPSAQVTGLEQFLFIYIISAGAVSVHMLFQLELLFINIILSESCCCSSILFQLEMLFIYIILAGAAAVHPAELPAERGSGPRDQQAHPVTRPGHKERSLKNQSRYILYIYR